MLAAGISTSVLSTAWGQQLYQTHSDGSIWQYTGTPCKGASCPGWIELDNNPNLSMIAAGGGALFEMHKDGSIWRYTGPACSGGFCPGWAELDNNPAAVAIGVGDNGVGYEVHGDDGSLWVSTGEPCAGGYCPGWVELQTNAFGGNSDGYPHYCTNGPILVWQNLVGEFDVSGNLSLFGGTIDSWTGIDPSAEYCAVTANSLYEVESGGAIRQYTGSPITYDWLTIDQNVLTEGIAAGGAGVYQQRLVERTGYYTTWQYTGTPCIGTKCPGWVKIDNHPYTGMPAVGSNSVYQLRMPPGKVTIWQYTGTPCKANVCSGWVQLDDNPTTTSIVAGPVTFPAYPIQAGF
jgi:hypothetical protein